MNNIIGQLQMMIDRIFLGHANDLYMSALGNVSSPVWTTMPFCNALVMGASILISQNVGAGRRDEIGEYAGAMMKYNNIGKCYAAVFKLCQMVRSVIFNYGNGRIARCHPADV